MAERGGVIGVISFFTALTLIGAAIGVAAVKDFAQARASAGWPTVDGVVLSSAESAGAEDVRYAYFYGRRNFESDRVKFLSACLSPEKNTYAAGQSVKVYISPENPAQSVLEPGGSAGVFAAAIFLSGVLVFIGLGGLVRAATKATTSEEGAAADDAAPDDKAQSGDPA